MVLEQYTELCFKGSNIEDAGACLVALGASGVVEEDPDILRCYLDNQSCDRAAIFKFASTAGLNLISDLPIEPRNWVALCREVWSELTVGGLSIQPVATANEETNEKIAPLSGVIRVIPGEGFGTGHHPSTRQAIAMMQSSEVSAVKPRSVIDVGTGSGILAIAAVKLFDADVRAFDIDQRALVNAHENVRLNSVDKNVQLHAGPLPIGLRCDLLLANIYAEILLQYEQCFFSTLNTGGFLVMAGIMQARLGSVVSGFDSSRWQQLAQLDEGGWCALLYRSKR